MTIVEDSFLSRYIKKVEQEHSSVLFEESSVDVKSDEEAILSLKQFLNCDIRFFTRDEIATIEDKYEGSEFVKKSIGVSAVSEPVIELAGANIIIKKIKKDGMTLAIGELN